MTAVNEIKALLFEELEHIAGSSARLIGRISPKDWDYRPRENMRSLSELVHHLASIPSTDLLILQEKGEPEIRKHEAEVEESLDLDKLTGWLTAGVQQLKGYMEELPEEEFLHRKSTPFYLESGSVQAKWLIEIVTHVQHHRAQLFNYLKQLGYEVNMFDLY